MLILFECVLHLYYFFMNHNKYAENIDYTIKYLGNIFRLYLFYVTDKFTNI